MEELNERESLKWKCEIEIFVKYLFWGRFLNRDFFLLNFDVRYYYLGFNYFNIY